MLLRPRQQNKSCVGFTTGETAAKMEQPVPSSTKTDHNAETLSHVGKEIASLIINRTLQDQSRPEAILRLAYSTTEEMGATI